MPSNDFNGEPVLILSEKEVRAIDFILTRFCQETWVPDSSKETYEKVKRFLKECQTHQRERN
jgi:hypothetical protein